MIVMNGRKTVIPFLREKAVLLAPMAGYTDSCFRKLCRSFGADGVVTEMVSADGLVREDGKSIALSTLSADERPAGIQLFGSSPETLSLGASVAERQIPDFIDLNYGCPVKKVVKRNAGASLLRDPNRAGDIISAVAGTVSVPLSAKIRVGWDSMQVNAAEVAIAVQAGGACFITVHGRTRDQGYTIPSSLSIIGDVVKTVDIPVVGNGDIFSPEDAMRMFDSTGCRGIMIGRGALGRPWIFKQVKDYIATGSYDEPPAIPVRLGILFWQIHKSVERMGEQRGIRWMRKHLVWYTRGMPFGTGLRRGAMREDTLRGIRTLFERYLAHIGEEEGSFTKDMLDIGEAGVREVQEAIADRP
jgi:tRNA-dihydrouridine synthase B